MAGIDVKMSLIVSTLGRDIELRPLLASLSRQKFDPFELIVVDQNLDDRLVPILADYTTLKINHLRTPTPGVCRARNLGAKAAIGDWLLFPDDDCWYPETFLETLEQMKISTPADFYAGRPTDALGQTIMGRFIDKDVSIIRENIWETLIEWLFCVRRSAFETAGGFDENIGPGSGTEWGAYEIQDLVLRCLNNGNQGRYSPDLTGHHPSNDKDILSPSNIAKMHTYSKGLGYVMRKHGYAFSAYLPRLLRPLAGTITYGLTGRPGMATRSWQIFRGRWIGWRNAPAPG